MLPRDLLIVSKRKGSIKPRYLKDTQIAEELIEIFREYEGRKYKELQEKLDEMEYVNYKVVRGLSLLLERRCEFESISLIDGKKIREFLFDRGFVLSEEERNKIIDEACKHFNLSREEIEEAMFSDLKEEQIIKKFYYIPPLELIKRYNLSLTQTLLFDALEMLFTISGNYQEVFRKIKYLGLMYEIEGNEVKITGPASLFKKTRKYGVAMAKLLPSIINADKWRIKAKIELRREARIYDFELSFNDDILLPRYTEQVTHFDSEVEERFYNEFKSLNTGWEIKREPTIIEAGNYIIIPDFGFYKDGIEHYLEVVGFWTPEYLKKKIWKLKNAKVNITIAVNENLSCKKEDFSGDVIFYNKKIPLVAVIKILRKLEEESIQKEMEGIEKLEIKDEIISLEEKAKELNVSKEALSRIKIPNYCIIGDKIVAKKFLEKLKEEIGEERSYEEAKKILDKYGLTSRALDYMGYKIEWKGLKPVKVVS
ncbi:translation initiation factor IF-2 [Thermoplasmatales archaeon ex4484_30]|nr:MAG: translation initiation factor IF-2 [Thermoplasmatales archaeon ex4484_30]